MLPICSETRGYQFPHRLDISTLSKCRERKLVFNVLEMDFQDSCTVVIVLVVAFILVYYISKKGGKSSGSGVYYETSPAIDLADDVSVDGDGDIDVTVEGGSTRQRFEW